MEPLLQTMSGIVCWVQAKWRSINMCFSNDKISHFAIFWFRMKMPSQENKQTKGWFHWFFFDCQHLSWSPNSILFRYVTDLSKLVIALSGCYWAFIRWSNLSLNRWSQIIDFAPSELIILVDFSCCCCISILYFCSNLLYYQC